MPEKESPKFQFLIVPSTKVAALLDRYPQLEDVLISLAPPFRKLKNPILRKTIGRVASLEQVAEVGRISISDLVNQLRVATDQPLWNPSEKLGDSTSYFVPQPEWFSSSRIVATIEEKNHDPNKMPIVTILERLASLNAGDIVELTTSFVPAPGIDLLRGKKLLVWTRQDEAKQIHTYICKPDQTRTTETT